ncbi:hypothetical protein GBAR_LOCUS23825, partial [Geodia barretti]
DKSIIRLFRAQDNTKVYAHETITNFLHFYSDEHRKKEVRITLHHQDIKKLNYLITYTDERRTRNKESFSFDQAVKKFRRIDLPKEGMQCSGRRLRTKDDLHLLKYRADIQQWIQEQDTAFRHVETSAPSKTPTKRKIWAKTKKILIYFLE